MSQRTRLAVLVGALTLALAIPAAADARNHLDRALDAAKAGDLDAAIAAAEMVPVGDPWHADARFCVAWAEAERNDHAKAAAAYQDVVKLRPVYHYTDPKVRAHLTLCMLSLLLQRSLERRLARSKHKMTAPACFEELSTGHLNRRAAGTCESAYVVTEPTQTQRSILKSLRMLQLIDEAEVAAQITPQARA